MKKCPNCGVDNSPESEACYSCFASLDGVAQDASSPTPPQARTMPHPRPLGSSPQAAPQQAPQSIPTRGMMLGGPLGGESQDDSSVSRVGVPLGGQPNQPRPPSGSGVPGAPPSPYGANPPRPRYTAPPERVHRAPASASRIGPILYALFVIAVVFGGGGFLAWRFYFLPQGPNSAVNAFIGGVQSRNMTEVQGTLSSNSQWMVKYAPQYINLFNSMDEPFKEDKAYNLVFKSIEGQKAVVLVKPGPEEIQEFKQDNLPPGLKDGYPIYCVKVGDKWKVDLSSTAAGLFPQFKSLQQRYSKLQ